MPWIVPFIPAIVGAAAGVGAAVYTSNKAEQAADEQAAIDAVRRKEAGDLMVEKAGADRDRAQGEHAAKGMMDDLAFDAEMSAMQSAAEGEKSAREQEKLLASQQAENEYNSKFKPGQGGLGDDTASDFLVPKVSDDTGLVRNKNDQGGNGLIAQIGFGG